jgi:hypothetical protein
MSTIPNTVAIPADLEANKALVLRLADAFNDHRLDLVECVSIGLTHAELPLLVPLSSFRRIRFCRQADSQACCRTLRSLLPRVLPAESTPAPLRF